MISSVGNDHLYEKHKAQIGDDVIAEMKVNCMRFRPLLDSCDDIVGTEFTQVAQYDPKGSIPDMLKSMMAKKQAAMADSIVAECRKFVGK